jgi:predicted acyl esterase
VRIKDLGTRPASASLRDMISRWARGHAPTTAVQRRELPYWQEHGWTREDNTYTGNYQTPYAAFQGWIEQERSGQINFFLHNPSAKIRSHSHWTCFQHRGQDWYLVHMGRQPRDVSSGIITIERLITEAYEQ